MADVEVVAPPAAPPAEEGEAGEEASAQPPPAPADAAPGESGEESEAPPRASAEASAAAEPSPAAEEQESPERGGGGVDSAFHRLGPPLYSTKYPSARRRRFDLAGVDVYGRPVTAPTNQQQMRTSTPGLNNTFAYQRASTVARMRPSLETQITRLKEKCEVLEAEREDALAFVSESAASAKEYVKEQIATVAEKVRRQHVEEVQDIKRQLKKMCAHALSQEKHIAKLEEQNKARLFREQKATELERTAKEKLNKNNAEVSQFGTKLMVAQKSNEELEEKYKRLQNDFMAYEAAAQGRFDRKLAREHKLTEMAEERALTADKASHHMNKKCESLNDTLTTSLGDHDAKLETSFKELSTTFEEITAKIQAVEDQVSGEHYNAKKKAMEWENAAHEKIKTADEAERICAEAVAELDALKKEHRVVLCLDTRKSVDELQKLVIDMEELCKLTKPKATKKKKGEEEPKTEREQRLDSVKSKYESAVAFCKENKEELAQIDADIALKAKLEEDNKVKAEEALAKTEEASKVTKRSLVICEAAAKGERAPPEEDADADADAAAAEGHEEEKKEEEGGAGDGAAEAAPETAAAEEPFDPIAESENASHAAQEAAEAAKASADEAEQAALDARSAANRPPAVAPGGDGATIAEEAASKAREFASEAVEAAEAAAKIADEVKTLEQKRQLDRIQTQKGIGGDDDDEEEEEAPEAPAEAAPAIAPEASAEEVPE
ncbi:hypothetical protein NFJ02_36g92230 [Pycnococcus provasolii]